VTYRAALTGRALSQFRDLIADPDAYAAIMDRITQMPSTVAHK
jgi:hypothetical protein